MNIQIKIRLIWKASITNERKRNSNDHLATSRRAVAGAAQWLFRRGGIRLGRNPIPNSKPACPKAIEDEFDQEEPLVRQTAGDIWELNGSLPAHKLGELVGERFDETGEVCTGSGLLTQRLGRFPRVGQAHSCAANRRWMRSQP